MLISREMSFEDLEKNSWCGAIDTIRTVREAGKVLFQSPLLDFSEEGVGETALWRPKSGFTHKVLH